MNGLLDANLIRLFDFYLALMLVIGTWRRRRVYWDAVRITRFTFGRKRLLGRVGEHKHLLLSRDVIRPFLLILGLMIVQWVCSRLIWPQATVTLRDELSVWWRGVLLAAAFLPMFAVDLYFLIRVGRFDRGETEKYLDQAEVWLGWRAPLVRVATLGFVNPRRMVDVEVAKGLQELSKTASWAMNWASTQAALRLTFGLVIWLLWLFG